MLITKIFTLPRVLVNLEIAAVCNDRGHTHDCPSYQAGDSAAEPLNVVFMALSSPSVPLVFAPSISNEKSECIDGHIHTLGSCFLAFVGHWG